LLAALAVASVVQVASENKKAAQSAVRLGRGAQFETVGHAGHYAHQKDAHKKASGEGWLF
jgi:hypothetical protein